MALNIPRFVKEELCNLRIGIPGARWCGPESMHLTLSFIGEVNQRIYAEILDVLEDIQESKFELRLKSVGYFGTKRDPKILWAGVEPEKCLLDLQKNIEKKLVAIGLPPSGKKYSPHITLARLKNTSYEEIATFIQTFSLFDQGPIAIDSFDLFSSKVAKAEYLVESTFDLI